MLENEDEIKFIDVGKEVTDEVIKKAFEERESRLEEDEKVEINEFEERVIVQMSFLFRYFPLLDVHQLRWNIWIFGRKS